MGVKVATVTDNGQTQGMIVLDEKVFSTGSRGFAGQGKIVLDGKKYQANFMLVEVGSKPQ